MRAWRDRKYLVVPRKRGRVPHLGDAGLRDDISVETHTFAADHLDSARVEIELSAADRRRRHRHRVAALGVLGAGIASSLPLMALFPPLGCIGVLASGVVSLITATSWMKLSAHRLEGDFLWIRGCPQEHLMALEDFREARARAAGALSPPSQGRGGELSP